MSAALATPPIVLTEGSAHAAASLVRLSAAFTSTGRVAVSGGQQRSYAVDIRPQGGVARAAALTLIAQRPLEWRGRSAECTANRTGQRLRCSLGDLSRSRRLQVVVFTPGWLRTAKAPRIVAIASAQNLTGRTTMNVRLPEVTAGTSTSPKPSGRPSGSGSRSPSSSSSSSPSSSSGPSPSSSGRPSESSGTASAASTLTPGVTPSGSPRKPGVSTPPRRKPLRTPSRHPGRRPHRYGTPGSQGGQPPAYNLAPPLQQQPPMQLPPMQPPPMQAPPAMPQPAMPQAPAAPAMPDVPAPMPGSVGEVPSQSAPILPPMTAPGSAGAPSGMVLPTPGAPGSSAAPAENDGNQMTLISPTGTDEEGTPWAVVLGIALVGELALLWLAACLGLVRRRFALAHAARATAVVEGAAASRRLPRAVAAVGRPFAVVGRPFAAVGRRLNPVRAAKTAARKLGRHTDQ